MLDQLLRPLEVLRLSVTDRCNLRCTYCMPEERYKWLRKNLILSFEELTRLVSIFQTLGVKRVRITGGEPLLRQDLPKLVEALAGLGLDELSMTTNGVLLARHSRDLWEAGLDRVTVSLDAVEPEIFAMLSQRDDLDRTLEGIASVAHTPGLKLDSVIIKGKNESQVLPLLDFARTVGAEVRFIEYMDVGGATRWDRSLVFSQDEILELVAGERGDWTELEGRGSAPASRFRLADGQVFGVIASTTRPFCGTCDRVRVTADGQLFTCLYSRLGRDLRALLRSGESDEKIAEALARIWEGRVDRGAERRLEISRRGPLANVAELQENQHLEMHTRGG